MKEWLLNYTWIEIAAILLFAWLVIRWKKTFHRKMIHHRTQGKLHFDLTTLEIFEKGVTVLVIFITAISILQIIGVDVVPVLTISGIGAAAVGFASRDMVANFFGGLMIYITRPFAIGDFIELPGKKIAGTVEEIGWYLTSIWDKNKRPLYIPNSLFSTEFLLNQSRMTHRFIDERIRVRPESADQMQAIVEAIRVILQKDPEIDHSLPIDVFVLTVSPYGIDIEIKGYSRETNYEEFMRIKQRILLKVYAAAYSEVK